MYNRTNILLLSVVILSSNFTYSMRRVARVLAPIARAKYTPLSFAVPSTIIPIHAVRSFSYESSKKYSGSKSYSPIIKIHNATVLKKLLNKSWPNDADQDRHMKEVNLAKKINIIKDYAGKSVPLHELLRRIDQHQYARQRYSQKRATSKILNTWDTIEICSIIGQSEQEKWDLLASVVDRSGYSEKDLDKLMQDIFDYFANKKK